LGDLKFPNPRREVNRYLSIAYLILALVIFMHSIIKKEREKPHINNTYGV
jgi:hypothetical protein